LGLDGVWRLNQIVRLVGLLCAVRRDCLGWLAVERWWSDGDGRYIEVLVRHWRQLLDR
jgi:hypothetical protein